MRVLLVPNSAQAMRALRCFPKVAMEFLRSLPAKLQCQQKQEAACLPASLGLVAVQRM